MASLNTAARELVLKIVYYGPGLGGKTTCLQALHEMAPPEKRGKLVSLATPVDRTLYFDFLPLRLAPLRGLAVRLQLFTVPGQVYFNATRRLVLSGADGIVFVADSQSERVDANLESLENLRENLAEHGRDLATLPHVLAYNKRDLPELLPIAELDARLNAHRAPSFGTVATRREGVQESLDAITKLVLAAYEAQLPAPSIERAVSVAPSPPSVVTIGRDDDVETSAARPARANAQAHEDDAVTTSVGRGKVLADVARIEAAAASRPPASEPESLLGPALARELERIEGGEARVSSVEPAASLTFAPLFSPAERALVEQIEQSIAHGDYADALGMCEAAIKRILGMVATLVASDGDPTPSDPALPLLLGIDGRRYLAFRALARRARRIGDVGIRDALESYAFVLEARVAFGEWDALRTAVGANSAPPPSRKTAPPPSGMPPLPRGTLSPPDRDDALDVASGK